MQEVVKKKIVKLLDTDIIYPIIDRPWVSPIHCVPKKGGITVVINENDELVPTRTVTDFSKIARPLTKLLEKDTPFEFNDECQKAFELLKEKLTCAPVIVSLNWNLPFELMCDASDFAVGAVLGPKDEIKDKKGTENVAADHLSRIDNNKTSDDSEVDDNFPREPLMEINTKDEPWFADFANYLGIDFMGPFPKSYKFEYILVAVDYVSKWAKAQAIPTNDARVVITFLKKLFCRFEMPKALISDRGTYFCNKMMEKTMNRYEVSHRFSTSYHPQTSGQVENTNIALKRIIEKIVKDNPAIWSRKLNDALWAFRTAYKTPIGTTPYKLIYGKNCHLPFEIEHRAYWALKNCNPDLITAGEIRMFLLHELDELRHQAYENSRLYKARTKFWHDKKLRIRKEFTQPKLRSRWLRPYIIRNKYAEDFLNLIKEWGKLCKKYKVKEEKTDAHDPILSGSRDDVTPSKAYCRER
ncbi:reverse transcriptase domain-containing protein [Tanacetum coccineum]